MRNAKFNLFSIATGLYNLYLKTGNEIYLNRLNAIYITNELLFLNNNSEFTILLGYAE